MVMDPMNWNLTVWSVWGLTIQPYLAITGMLQPAVGAWEIVFACYTVLSFPVWGVITLRARRYLVERHQPSLGYAQGDRVVTRGERATLKHRMLAMPLILGPQPLLGAGADPESWWAVTVSGSYITAHAPIMEHLPVLDRLAEI